MKKVLVIIDNLHQYVEIKKIIKEKDKHDLVFDFYHSNIPTEIWGHPDFKGQNKNLDVKAETKWIIENFHMVISVHCYQFFPPELVNEVRCINIHPGYNPINRGWYPQVFAIINDLEIGATIHEMDEKLDNGPIICRKLVDKFGWDTSFTLYNRVLNAELELLDENFDSIFHGGYNAKLPENKGNFYSKKDFHDLCKIDLDQKVTYGEAINRFRSLSHGDYLNAYFIDPDTKKKIFLNLSLLANGE